MKNLSNMNKVRYKVILDNQLDSRMLPNHTTVNLIGIDNFRKLSVIEDTIRQRFIMYNVTINHTGRTVKISHKDQDQEWKKVIESI